MEAEAIERFEDELAKWVRAHAKQWGTESTPGAVTSMLRTRIPDGVRFAIGSGFLHGALATTKGYWVGPPEAPGSAQYLFTSTRTTNTTSAPCWEMFVQLAEYARLRALGERRGIRFMLEYNRMDIAAFDATGLLAYLEIKVDKDDARRLVAGVKKKGSSGINPDAIARHDDAAKKTNYILVNRPRYFAVRAIGFDAVFEVAYDGSDRFRLLDPGRTLEDLLQPRSNGAVAVEHHPVDALDTQLRELCPELWAAPGRGQTALNFYVSQAGGERIVLGVYKNGELWCDPRPFTPEQARLLSTSLASARLELAIDKAWSHLRRDGKRAVLAPSDVEPLSGAMRSFLDAAGLGHA